MVLLCMCLIFVILITNYIIFLMIEKYTTVEEKQYEEEMIQREILYRNEYYQDMEMCIRDRSSNGQCGMFAR